MKHRRTKNEKSVILMLEGPLSREHEFYRNCAEFCEQEFYRQSGNSGVSDGASFSS
jgi:hypothetical protein